MGESSVFLDGATVRRLRTAKALTQEALASLATVPTKTRAGAISNQSLSKKTISNVERGRPCSLSVLRAISNALGVQPGDLLLIAEEPQSPALHGSEPVEIACSDDEHELSIAVVASAAKRIVLIESRLPPLPPLMVGREHDVITVKDRLLHPTFSAASSRAVTVAVYGWPGVGKTSLASVVAHDRDIGVGFPDGILWSSFGAKPDLIGELRSWARHLGIVEEYGMTTSAETLSRAIASRLWNRRVLLILDDVWETEHAAPFCVASGGCATLVTTRTPIVALALAPTLGNSFALDVLSEGKAVELLKSLAPAVVDRHPEECRELVNAVERLPLALQVAGRMLRIEAARGWEAGDLLRELRSDVARLLEGKAPPDLADLVSQTTPTIAMLLRKSTDRLDAASRDRYAYLGAFAPKPATFRLTDMAGVWRISESEAKTTASELVDRGLLEPIEANRFWMHALLVAHADSLCKE